MKTFRELRQLAAEFESRRLSADYDVVIVQRRDERSPTTIHTIPAIFERSELERHEREKRSASAKGLNPERIPIPVALLDFSAWTYSAFCPKCSGRRLSIRDDAGEERYVSGRSFDDVEYAREHPDAQVTCLRPTVPEKDDRKRNCGWSGVAADLAYQCFACGRKGGGAIDGECSSCSDLLGRAGKAAPKARKKPARKKAAKKKTVVKRKGASS